MNRLLAYDARFHLNRALNEVACSQRGSVIQNSQAVRIFNRATLVAFWTKHKDAEGPLRLWFSVVERAQWSGPSDLRALFGSADLLLNNRVVFDIKGNRYRIIAQIKYAPLCLVYIRFIGTHAEYVQIDARTI